MVKLYKIKKGNIVKEVPEDLLYLYLNKGWEEVKERKSTFTSLKSNDDKLTNDEQ